MKKNYLSIFLFILLVLCLCSCGSQSEEPQKAAKKALERCLSGSVTESEELQKLISESDTAEGEADDRIKEYLEDKMDYCVMEACLTSIASDPNYYLRGVSLANQYSKDIRVEKIELTEIPEAKYYAYAYRAVLSSRLDSDINEEAFGHISMVWVDDTWKVAGIVPTSELWIPYSERE